MSYSFKKFYKVWALIASILNLLGLGVALHYGTTLPWIIGSALVYGFFIACIPAHIPKWSWLIGYANWVSVTRLFIIIVLFILYPFLDNIILFTLFLVAICLDGVDGYFARRFGHNSEVGGELDMEIDGFMVLVLSWIHVDQQNLGWLILIPGGIKYGIEILFFWLSRKEKDLMPKKYKAGIGVSFFLTLLLPFVTNDSFLMLLPYGSGVLIIFSFMVTTFYQLNILK